MTLEINMRSRVLGTVMIWLSVLIGQESAAIGPRDADIARRVPAIQHEVCGLAGAESSARHVDEINSQWRFHRGPAANPTDPLFDDSQWQTVTVPHTYNAEDGERGGEYYRGEGWYRRAVSLASPVPDQRLYLQFDGAAIITDVWLNGQFIGRHEGGYAAFRFDITRRAHAGRNVIVVRVDNSKTTAIAPLGGDFTIFGGLYRGVSILTTSSLQIDALDFGGPGVYATVTQLLPRRATISVQTRVRNDSKYSLKTNLRARVYDDRGGIVAETTASLNLTAGGVRDINQAIQIGHPHLWNARRDPYLYRVRAQLSSACGAGPQRVTDTVSVPLGIRSISIDANRGLLLNGTPYPVHGVDLFHTERPGHGTAVTDENVDEDLNILNELGLTALRLVHFQHPQRIYDDADRLGLLIWTELPLNSAMDSTASFTANGLNQLQELIRQNRNHPSVIVWGLGNEIYKSDEASHRLLATLSRAAHAEDPSRLTVYAHCCAADNDPQAMQTDVIAYNRYFGWYDGELRDIGTWADQAHLLLPHRAIAVSEYGAGASVFQQEDPPRRPVPKSEWHPEQYQTLFHETYWRILSSKAYLWATFAWVAFDLPSSGRAEGDRAGINDKGLVTYDRKIRKDAFYWYKVNWNNSPMVYITSRRAVRRPDSVTGIKVYSNTQRVRLRVNGVELESQIPREHIALWRGVQLRPGMNHIEAFGDGISDPDVVDWEWLGNGSSARVVR